MTTDIIFIDRIQTTLHIGTSTEERALPQPIAISIRLSVPLREAGRTDDLKESIDYGAIEQTVRKLAEESRFHLVEALAETIAMKILQWPNVSSVWVRIEKHSIKGNDGVGVEICRERS